MQKDNRVFYHLPILNFFYRAIRKFKKGVKVKLDLTKKHHSLHLEANMLMVAI